MTTFADPGMLASLFSLILVGRLCRTATDNATLWTIERVRPDGFVELESGDDPATRRYSTVHPSSIVLFRDVR